MTLDKHNYNRKGLFNYKFIVQKFGKDWSFLQSLSSKVKEREYFKQQKNYSKHLSRLTREKFRQMQKVKKKEAQLMWWKSKHKN